MIKNKAISFGGSLFLLNFSKRVTVLYRICKTAPKYPELYLQNKIFNIVMNLFNSKISYNFSHDILYLIQLNQIVSTIYSVQKHNNLYYFDFCSLWQVIGENPGGT